MDKDRIDRFGVKGVPVGGTEHVTWWSSTDAGAGRSGSLTNIDDQTLRVIQQNATLASSIMPEGAEIPIWQKARAATHQGNHPQQVLSQLDSINLRKDAFAFMDLETVGTLNPNARRGERMGYVSPTEIAIQNTKIYNGKSKIVSDLNMVVGPGRHYESLNKLLLQLESSPFEFAKSMSVDERRSLEDLILYSDKSHFGATTINGQKVTTIARQARGAQPLGIASLANASTIQKMRFGLDNLHTLGTDPITAIEVMSDYFEEIMNQTKGQMRIAGQNIRAFDLPVVNQMIQDNMVGEHKNNPKLRRALDIVNNTNYIDTLEVEKTLNTNITSKYPNLKLSSLAESRKVLNYKGKYIEPGVSSAHFAPYDVEINGRVFASQLQQHRRLKKNGPSKEEVMKGDRFISYNTKSLKAGERLFSLSGVSGYEAGKYDAVYDANFKPISTIQNTNPLYRNSTYRIQNYRETEIDDKKMYTMTLFNEDRDTYHTFVRDNLEDLQNIIHKNMEYLPSNPTGAHKELAKRAMEDSAVRRYNKMFSTETGGGINLYNRYSKALEAYEANKHLPSSDLKAAVRKAAGHSDGQGGFVDATSSFYRDFDITKERFAKEKQFYDPFVQMITGDTQFKGNKQAQNMALQAYHDKMDKTFGKNKTTQDLTTAGINHIRSVLPLDIDGSQVNVQVSNDIDATLSSLNRAIGSGHVAENMSTHTAKGRLLQVVNQLRAKDHMTQTAAKDIMATIKNLKNNDSSWYVLRDIALQINQAQKIAAEKGQVLGLRTIDIEDPTTLVPARAQSLQSGFKDQFGRIAKESIAETMPYVHRAYNGIDVPPNSPIERILSTHDRVIQGMAGNTAFGNTIKNPKPVKKVLEDLVTDYVDKDGKTGTTLFYGGKNEVTLAVYGIDMADQVRGMNYEQIMKNNRIVTMSIPLMKENQNLRYGTQERLGRLKVVQNGQSMQFTTGFDEVVQGYKNMRERVFDMINQKKEIDATTMLRGLGRKKLENLSQNRTKARRDKYDDPFRVTESRAANWARRGTVDFSNLAETWWKEQYGADNPNILRRIEAKMAKNPGMQFVEAMGGMTIDQGGRKVDPTLRWSLDMEEWLAGKGIDVNTHSIKNTLVNNDVRSYNDVGELTPFGNYNAAAREKHFKVLNYLPLDEKDTRTAMLKEGYSRHDVRRMMRLGTTTDRWNEVVGDELNYLSMRTGYATTGLVAEEFKNPHLSTSEGMFILRKELASAFTVKERKFATLTEGAHLHKDIVSLLSKPGEKADLSQSITLDKPISIQEAISNNLVQFSEEKGITVGGIQRDLIGKSGTVGFTTSATGERKGKTTFHKTDYYKDLHLKNTFIKGWDADRGALVMDVVRTLEDGDKMLGSGGLRGTVSLVEGKVIDQTRFKGMDAILPQINLEHRDSGALMRSASDLAYDEMRRKVTTGKIALEDGLRTLTELMSKHLGVSETDIRVEENRIVLNKTLGLDKDNPGGNVKTAKQIHAFLEEAGHMFNSDLLNESRGFMIGQTGLAISATPKWENRVGTLAIEQEGPVRWGLKEIDMINDRLEAVRVGETASGVKIKTSAMHKWLNSADVSGGIQDMMKAQNPEGSRMTKALTRTLLTAYDQTEARPGDIVIRTQANKGDFGPNNDGGRNYAYVDERGVTQVSGDVFSNLPSTSRKGGFQTVGDLQNTIITMHQNELAVGNEYGPRQTLGQTIQANHGTALVELPQGLDQSHIRFVSSDVSRVGANEMAVMNELQSKEASIWRGIQEYSATNSTRKADKIKADLQRNVNEYHGITNRMLESSRDGSISKTAMSVMLDNSGRFKIQGINPAEALSRQYEEGVQYVSRKEMSTMISGAEQNIATTLGIDIGHIDLAKANGKLTVQNLVLDKITEDGLYGFVGRYPTITRDTLQVSKIQIDPKLGDKQGMYSTLATSIQLKGDYDGDFGNIALSHYGHVEDPKLLQEMHQEMKMIHEDNRMNLNSVLADQSSKTAKDIHGEVHGANMTIGDLAKEDLSFAPQRGGIYNVESTTARVNAALIGRADNTRLKIWNLADSTYDILANNGRIGEQEASASKKVLQEFGRVLSQDYISSKKFDVEGIAKQLGVAIDDPTVRDQVSYKIQDSLASFMEGIMKPNDVGIRQMQEANDLLGLFKDKEQFGEMTDALKTMHGIHGDQYLYNKSLGMGVSEGGTAEVFGDIATGKTGQVHSTPFVQRYLELTDGDLTPEIVETRSALQKGIELNEKRVLNAWDRRSNPQASFANDSYRLGEEMLGGSAVERTGYAMKDFAGTLFGELKGSGTGLGMVGVAAGVFGGMWATSSLMRKAPTPEGNEAQQEGGMSAPIPQTMMSAPPTARITPNEDITIRISGRDASGMTNEQISALVQSEMNAMVPMGVNMNLNVNDNTQNMDKSWLQGVMANALNFGNAF